MNPSSESMEEQSYDGTEHTPQPQNFRPPAMHSQIRRMHNHNNTSNNTSTNTSNSHNNSHVSSTTSSRLQQESSEILSNSLFSYSTLGGANTSSMDDGDVSLPSLQNPPSPISHPNVSVLEEDSILRSRTPRTVATQNHQFYTPANHSRAVSRHSPQVFFSAQRHHPEQHQQQHQQQQQQQSPPMSEVRVQPETQMDDSFFECEDQSIAERTRRSLRIDTPTTAKLFSIPDEASMDASAVSSIIMATTAHTQVHNTPKANATPRTTIPTTPSDHEVSRVHESALQALLRLKEELLKSNDRNKELQQEKDGLVKDLQDKQQEWQTKTKDFEESISTLKASEASLKAQLSTWQEEKEAMKQTRQDLETKLRSATRERKELMHAKLATDNKHKDLQRTLEQTRTELESVVQRQTQLATDYSIVSREKAQADQDVLDQQKQVLALQEAHVQEDATLGDLQATLTKKEAELASLTATLSEKEETHREQILGLTTEVDTWKNRYREEQDQYKVELQRLKATLKASPIQRVVEKAAYPKASPSPLSTTSRNTSPTAGTPHFESAITDRLARMRDSAERAHLIKGHKREMTRLKLDHEQDLQRLSDEHQEGLRKLQKEAEASLSHRVEDLKKSLKQEHDEAMEQVQKKNQEKLSQIQKEFMLNQETSDESLQAALNKIATVTQHCEREINRRASVEESLQKLQLEMEEERKDLQARHTQEIAKRREEWEGERDTLLTMIQQDCNSAFDQQRRLPTARSMTPGRWSPPPTARSSSTAGSTPQFFGAPTVDIAQTQQPKDPGTPIVSPTFSTIDDVLKETEDLIQSIL